MQILLTIPTPCDIVMLFVLPSKVPWFPARKGERFCTGEVSAGMLFCSAYPVVFTIVRMGVPYREKGISGISAAVDAPMNKISSLSGKPGMFRGVNT